MFWNDLGVGSLINLQQTSVNKRNDSLIQEQSLRSLRQALGEMLASRGWSGEEEYETEHEEGVQLIYSIDSLAFPEDNFEALRVMQQDYADRRNFLLEGMRHTLARLKDDYFDECHYATHDRDDGFQEMDFADNGAPIVVPGYETPEQKVLRRRYEQKRREELIAQHDQVRDEFLSQARAKTIAFLRITRERLDVPEVCDELYKLLLNSRREAAAILAEQEKQLWLAELPDSEAMCAQACAQLAMIHDLDRQQAEAEQASPDMQTICDFERELAQYICQCRYQLQAQRADANNFLDPKRALAASLAAVSDFSEMLPAHLCGGVRDLGIETADLL